VRRLLPGACWLACLLVLGGCGLGAGTAPKGVELLVTRDFGAHILNESSSPRTAGAETIMSLLERNLPVATRYGGGFVESIAGLSGGSEAGRPVDWFYYVNGVQAGKGAAAKDVHPGDRIWWDRHDWSQAESIPAVVGSYPEPFLSGYEGKRLPVRIECADAEGAACKTIDSRLQAAGVPAAISAMGAGGSSETLRVLVGPWSAVGREPIAEQMQNGPRASGVYAVPAKGGQSIALLDEGGRTVAKVTGRAGLIAALREGETAPVWVVTGTDEAGVELAAKAFEEASLRDRFAVAVTQAGVQALPEAGR
jgi:hypothetical protein